MLHWRAVSGRQYSVLFVPFRRCRSAHDIRVHIACHQSLYTDDSSTKFGRGIQWQASKWSLTLLGAPVHRLLHREAPIALRAHHPEGLRAPGLKGLKGVGVQGFHNLGSVGLRLLAIGVCGLFIIGWTPGHGFRHSNTSGFGSDLTFLQH